MAARLMLAIGALVVCTVLALGLLTYSAMKRLLVDDTMGMMTGKAQVAASILSDYCRFSSGDLQALQQGPVMRDVIAVLESGSPDPADPALRRLEQALLAQAEAKPRYLQYRLLDGNGMELVRVERSSTEQPPFAVHPSSLQDKHERQYFIEAMEQPRAGLYVSELDLNVEHGRIEVPHRPVLRYAAPVHGRGSTPLGVLVINLDMRPVLEELRSSAPPGWSTYVAGERGEFLLHPRRGEEFSLQLGGTEVVQREFPGLEWPGTDTAGNGLIIPDEYGRPTAIAGSVCRLDGDRRLFVFFGAPESLLNDMLQPTRRIFMATGAVCILLALLVALGLSRAIAGPLEKMTGEVRAFDGKRMPDLPVDAGGEAGLLARSFRSLMSDLAANQARLQQELRESSEAHEQAARQAAAMSRFQALVNSTSDAIITKDLEGTITSWNPAAERLYSYTAEEAIGRHISMIVPAERLGDVNEIIQRVRSGETLESFETQRIRKDGQLLDVQLTASGIRDRNGEVSAVSVIARDITERKFNEGLFRMVVEASPSGIILADESGTIMMANGTAEQMFGYFTGELQGLAVENLVPGELRRQHVLNRAGFKAQPDTRQMGHGRDLRGLRLDGSEFPIEIGLNPVRTSRGLLVLAVVIDITDRKHSEEQLARKNEDLERSNRDLEQFAYIASHDLKEPLRMVASYTELLEERYADKLDEKGLKYIHYARDGARRMQNMVADLLKFSRISSGPLQVSRFSLQDLLDEILLDLRQEIRDSAAIITHDELPVLVSNENMWRQLLQNLLSNAIKFRSERRPEIHVGAERKGSWWQVSVTDNGIGIDPQFSERIFQMFQRLHARSEYEGNGIGLAIARRIVERLGGKLWLESAPGNGSTFVIAVQSEISPTNYLEGELEHD